MRSMFRSLAVTFAVVLALGAVSASSAFASPEWYVKKAGVFSKVTTSVKVESEGTLTIKDNEAYSLYGAEGRFRVECKFADAGTVGPGGAGSISGWSASGCKCFIICKAPISARAEHLSWSTELYVIGSENRNRITTGVGGTPAWLFSYETALFGPEHDECGLNTSAHATNNASGGVETAFDSNSNGTACTQGGRESGEWRGVLTIKPTAAEKTAGVEAIKVE